MHVVQAANMQPLPLCTACAKRQLTLSKRKRPPHLYGGLRVSTV